jgi:Trk-type K+ transport system membrane component
MEELGGVEYRALNMLFWIVLIYWLFLPLAGATIIAPYIAAGGRYDHVFDDQPKHVRIPWFAFFQATSAFSNSGTSLVDQSMIPFQRAYVMSAFMMVLILMGNTCYPICLRFIIWVLFKTFPKGSQTRETLKFLLDHPRRCFVYLFPSTQTWFLLFVVIVLTCIDWVSFLVLDLGTPVIMEIPKGTRVAAGLFQSIAVRAAGFAIVPMNDLAPAVKVMYVIMMYISVYPIAMSVRSTNVYEERALGVFDDDDENEEDEDAFEHREGAHAVAKYLGWHARRQLAFDMWWVVLSLWLVCIIERGALNDPAKHNWMNIFNILFELVSAYGTVGLSLGVPFDNYSLSGAFRKLSKLIVIVVMLRGRHRGLPLAIDRAVMLPKDFTQSDERAFESRIRRSRSRRASSMDVMSQGSAFPRTFTAMSDAQQQTSVVPSSPRLPARERDSSPSAPFRRHERTLSQTSSTDTPPTNAASGPLTPTSLHFAIGPNPRAAFPAAHLSSFNSLGGGAASGTSGATGTSPSSGIPSSHAGILSPVHEDPHSRRGTITEISGTEAVGGGNRNVDEGEHVHVRDFAVETPLHSPVDETTPTGSPRDTMSGTTTAASSNSATAVSN